MRSISFIACSDIKLIVEGTELAAHRAILCARSAYFDAMFAHKMKESIDGEAKIEEVSLYAFRQLLR